MCKLVLRLQANSSRRSNPDFRIEERRHSSTDHVLAIRMAVMVAVITLLGAAAAEAGTTDCATDWTNFDSNPGYIAEYTFQGQPIADHETSADPSNGGTGVAPDSIDLASAAPGLNPGPLPTPFFGYYNGGTQYDPDNPSTLEDDYIYFAMRVEADPTASNAFISRHWNVLLDVDADGYKEYWVDLDGTVKSNGDPDEIHIYYDNNNRQDIPDPKKNPQIEVETFTALADEDIAPGCSNGVSHSRAYSVPGDAGGDWIIEIQVPVTAFNDLNGNQVLYPDSPVAFVFSTSASNTDPLQKDFMMDIDFLSLNDPITFGDIIIPNGKPQIEFIYEDFSSADYYLTGAPTGDYVYIQVVDRFANTDPNTPECIQVTVTDTATGDDETVTLCETGPNSGQFTNQGGACSPTISPVVDPPTAWLHGGVDTSNATVAEDWTLTYSLASGTWSVSGSVSGAQTATATAGTPYTSDGGEIGFTLYENSPADNTTLTFCTVAADPLITTTAGTLGSDADDDDGQIHTLSGDEITVSYTTGTGHPTPNLTVTDSADILEACEAYIQFTRSTGLPTENFELGLDLLYVTVTLSEAAGSGSIDVVLTGNDTQTLTLDETGPSTGVFRNSSGLPTQVDDGTVTAEDGLWEDIDEGVVTATYDYTCGGSPYTKDTTATLFYIDAGGRVAFTNAVGTQDVTVYGDQQPIYVTVTDEGACDCRTCGTVGGLLTFTVTVSSTTGDSETVTVTETASGSGVFRSDGSVPAETYSDPYVIDDGTLEAAHDDLLTVSYTDCDDGDGDPSNNVKTDTARFNAPPLLINEVLYRPYIDTLDPSSFCQTEAIELINVASGTVTATGYTLTDGDGWSYTIPLFEGSDLILQAGERIFVSLYPTIYNPTDFYDALSGTYYLFALVGSDLPSDQLSDGLSATDSDQVMLYDSAAMNPSGIQDYIGWGLPPPPMNLDFNSDDSDAVFRSIWTDDAYRDITGLTAGESIERAPSGVDTDVPGDWQISDGTDLTDCQVITASLAFISDFSACRVGDGRTVVRWQTSSENGTLGFDLYRVEDGHSYRVHGPTVASVQAPQGGIYHVVDRHADGLSSATYRLVEREAGKGWGREVEYGPFSVEIETAPADLIFDPTGPDVQTIAHRPSVEHRARLLASKAKRGEERATRRRRAGGALKIAVTEDGLYEIPLARLTRLFNAPGRAIVGLARSGQLVLTNRGQHVAWKLSNNGRSLLFWGQGPDSPYTTERVYWLREGRGTLMDLTEPPENAVSQGAVWFTDSLTFEHDLFPATALVDDPADDFFFWDYLFADHPDHGQKTLTIELPDVAAVEGRARLEIRLQGATDSGIAGEHHVQVSVNGTAIGSAQWQGLEPYELTLNLDQSLLNDGTNEVQMAAVLDSVAPYSLVYLDSMSMTYSRRNVARDGQLVTRAEGHEVLTVTGFGSSDILVLDLTDPRLPRNVRGITTRPQGSTWSVDIAAGNPSGVYVAAETAAFRAPTGVVADVPSSLADRSNQADWVAIAPDELVDAARDLARSRQARGLVTMVVTLEDVIDEFNYGEFDPEAVRAFLAHAFHHWALAPRYAVLIGNGTFDYRDRLGIGGNLVPPLLAASDEGLFSADALYGDVAGDDGRPEIAVGRLPILSPEELDAYVAKLAAFENGASLPWRSRLALVADDNPGGPDTFRIDSMSMAAPVRGAMGVEPIFLSELADEAAREALIDAFQNGSGIISYAGHGSLDRLADEPLLLLSDVPELGNAATPPVLVAWSCSINRFELPGFPSLGGLLVSDPGSGAVAVWAPSGYSNSDGARWLGQELFRSLFEKQQSTLGAAIVEAVSEFHVTVGSESMTRHFVLLGDPSVLVQ
jgi:hypothetical protein